jgi:hypothetical protein
LSLTLREPRQLFTKLAEFTLLLRDAQTGVFVGEYDAQGLSFEIKNSEVGSMSCELALGTLQFGSTTQGMIRDSFAPYRTDFELWRRSTGQPVIMTAGMITSVNLNTDRDSVLISGKDWLHYLERRIYPWNPDDYKTLNPDNPDMHWAAGWPKQWPADPIFDIVNVVQNPVEVREIVEDIIDAMNEVSAPDGSNDGVLIIGASNADTGTLTKYQIYPGDSTTILDHIRALSELVDGFEYHITPLSRQFIMWSPRRDPNDGVPIWHIRVNETDQEDESSGAIIDFDWTNDGPEGTFLIGVGTRDKKAGAVWTDPQTRQKFRWLDKVYDYGALAPNDVILEMLKDQFDLWPQKKLSLTLLNPQFMTPSFYSAGRPWTLIGQRIRATHNFRPYHTVDAYFRVNAVNIRVDDDTNEEVTLELEMLYDGGETSGGIPQNA